MFGFAESPEVTFRTLPGVPSGELELTVSDVRAYSADFSWNQIPDETGDIGMLLYLLLLLLYNKQSRKKLCYAAFHLLVRCLIFIHTLLIIQQSRQNFGNAVFRIFFEASYSSLTFFTSRKMFR